MALAALSGCRQNVDLDAVRMMSQSASAAQASFDNVAQDFHETCVRKLRWEYLKQTAKSSAGELSGIDEKSYQPQRCDDALTTTAIARWKAFNRLYLGYFVAMGNIAGAKSDANAYGIQSFAKTIVESRQFGGASNATPIKDAATALTAAIDEVFNARKRDAISGFAGTEGAKFIAKAIPGLVNASNDLSTSLGFEEDAVNDFYVETFKHTKGGTDMLAALRYRQDWAADLKTVQNRREAITSYQNAIGDLEKAHGALVDSIKSDKPQAVASIVQLYLSEFQPLVEKMNASFK